MLPGKDLRENYQIAQLRDEESINLGAILEALLRNFRKIIAITSCAVLLGLLFVMVSYPKFISNGSLYTGGVKQSAPVTGDLPGAADTSGHSYMSGLPTFNSVSDIQTQVNVLTSSALVQQAVLATGLNTSISGPGISSPRYFVWKLLDRSSISTYGPSKTSLQALYASFVDPSIVSEDFTVSFRQAGHYTINSKDGGTVLAGVLNQPASGDGLNLLLQVPNGGPAPAEGSEYELTISAPAVTAEEILKGPLSVLPAGTMALPSEVMNISFSWWNPYQAKAFVDKLMSGYIDTVVSWNSSSASTMESFIGSQLNDDSAKLAATNQSLATYQQKTGMISPTDNAKNAIDQASQYEAQRAQLQIQIMALQQFWNTLDNHDPGLDPYMLSQVANTPISQISEKLAQDVADLKMMQMRFDRNTPQIAGQLALIAQERIAIRSMIKNELLDAETNLNSVNAQIAKYETQIGAMPSESLQIAGLTRSSEVLGQLYVSLMQKQQEAALSKALALSATQVLMPAQLPLRASEPRGLRIIAIALVLGLFGSCVWVLGRQAPLSGHLNIKNEIRSFVKSRVFVSAPEPPVSAINTSEVIEVELPNGCLVRVGSEVDRAALSRIITAISNFRA
jgi:tyrosine-protein kinase Etk/Wzc